MPKITTERPEATKYNLHTATSSIGHHFCADSECIQYVIECVASVQELATVFSATYYVWQYHTSDIHSLIFIPISPGRLGHFLAILNTK